MQARTFLAAMPPKPPVPLEHKFPNADRGALALLQKLIAFDPSDRPSAAEALSDPYFAGLPSTTQPAPSATGYHLPPCGGIEAGQQLIPAREPLFSAKISSWGYFGVKSRQFPAACSWVGILSVRGSSQQPAVPAGKSS
eukprot:scaffold61532_cov19-Tisochrysis_lutea.AAC.1